MRLAGIEPATFGFEVRRSVRLSYGRDESLAYINPCARSSERVTGSVDGGGCPETHDGPATDGPATDFLDCPPLGLARPDANVCRLECLRHPKLASIGGCKLRKVGRLWSARKTPDAAVRQFSARGAGLLR